MKLKKKLDHFAPVKEIVLHANNKPHMTQRLKIIMEKPKQTRIKANKHKRQNYEKQRNLVVKLIQAIESFLPPPWT